MKLSVVVAIIGCFFSACGPAIHEYPVSDIPNPMNYKASELTYASVYERVLRPNCVSCHGNAAGVNLETYENVKTNLQKIYEAVLVRRKMPKAPAPPLTPDQLGILNAWIKAGAPETAPDGGTGPLPIPLGPTFDSIKYNILEPKCLFCHAPGKSVARIPLVIKDDLLNSPLDIVLPGNPDESGIMLAVRGVNPDKLMPPPKDLDGKPTGFTKLSDKEIEAIAVWISNGAKD